MMASDPYFYGGAWTADTCQKVERFVDIAQTFHLPVVYLVDCPGFLIGLEAETDGHDQAGRARDVGDLADDDAVVRDHHPQRRSAWPAARTRTQPLLHPLRVAVGALGLAAARGRDRGGLSRRPRRRADDPEAKLAEIEERLNKLRSPFRSAETFWIEEIIDPRDTRPLLCEFANLAAPLRRPGPYAHPMRP